MHTTIKAEEEPVADETKLITNLICQDVESLIKTNEQEYINYCMTCKDSFKSFYNSYLLSFTVDIQETNKQFLKQLHNATSEHNFYICSFSFTSIQASKNQYIEECKSLQ